MTPHPVAGYPYAFSVDQLRPGMVTAYSRFIIDEVGKTGGQVKRGNKGTYYEEWKIELVDPKDSERRKTYRNMIESDPLAIMLNDEGEPIYWEEKPGANS